MASNKEILNAQRFNRQRLVTAFTAGAPDGRELEPKSLGKPLIAGVVLTCLILLGAWVSGFFAPTLPNGWENGTLIVVKGEGTRYVTIEGELRPLRNTASAKLMFEAGQLKQATVSASALNGFVRGTTVGIVEAPDFLPPADALVPAAWVSCPVTEQTTWLGIGVEPQSPIQVDRALVRTADDTFLISKGLRYQIDPTNLDQIRLALNLDTAPVTEVSATWINLFQPGTTLQPVRIAGVGSPALGLPKQLADAVVGSILEIRDSNEVSRRFIVVDQDSIVPLNDFTRVLYEIGDGKKAGNPLTVDIGTLSEITMNETLLVAPADWPTSLAEANPVESVPCARLIRDADTAGTILFAAAPPSAEGVFVKGGSGALVKSSGGGTIGSHVLITDANLAFGIEDNPTDTLSRLGYKPEDVAVVPASWIAAIPPGPGLSPTAAWASVTTQ